MIGTFLALLELAKQGAIAVVQPELFGSIDIARRVENPEQFQRLVDGIADVEDQGLPASEALGGEAQVAESAGSFEGRRHRTKLDGRRRGGYRPAQLDGRLSAAYWCAPFFEQLEQATHGDGSQRRHI